MLYVVFLSFIISPSFGARILGIASAPSYSHQIVFHPLWKELSSRGHQLTVLTTHPLKDPSLTNLTEIDLHSTCETWNKVSMIDLSQKNIIQIMNVGLKVADDLMNEQLEHPEVQILLKNKNEHFDLLIVEALLPAMYAFSERFNCPFIQVSSLDAPSRNYDIIGNPSHPVLNPYFLLPFAGKLNFWERLISTMSLLFLKYCNNVHVFPSQDLVVKKHFGDAFPALQDIARNVSMLFVNTNPILHQIRPLLPSIVEIGSGIHLKTPQKLPKDLQNYLDNASQGFIYFSLGTNVKSTEISENVRKVLLETFSELPYTILWKFEQENLSEKSENVVISKWFPQQDIFRHPNIKLFFTQGGLQSIEEAVYNHIPIVGMPFVGDQRSNIKNIVSKGLGLSVDYTSVNKETLKHTILEVINNPKYRARVAELAELVKDQPMTGLDRAVWWTEYVLRHKGAKHLRSPAMDLPTYQYFLVDVISFCLLVVFLITYLTMVLIRIVCKFAYRFIPKSKIKMN